ncbi:MAG: hypothetical protein J5I90_22345 [Caldilineales bacterium]|nr:hypothetical protein [Caldilineales bacterium]
MNDMQQQSLNDLLRQSASAFVWPATPDIAAGVASKLAGRQRQRYRPRRGLAMAAALALVVLLSLLAIPQARAAMLEVLRIGAVRIHLLPPEGTATPTAEQALSRQQFVAALDLAGRTTLDEAQAKLGFPLLLPGPDSPLPQPDAIYLQRLGGWTTIMVWLDDDGHPTHMLMQIGPGGFLQKGLPVVVAETEVNGRPAFWTEGPYFLLSQDNAFEFRQLVEGRVLIWEEDGKTYRLESDLSMEEAVAIAETLR